MEIKLSVDHRRAAFDALAKAENQMQDLKGKRLSKNDAIIRLLNINSNLLDALVNLEFARDQEGK